MITISFSDDTVENSDISTPFSKIETVLVNQSNEGESEDLMDDSITAVYSVCKDDTGIILRISVLVYLIKYFFLNISPL